MPESILQPRLASAAQKVGAEGTGWGQPGEPDQPAVPSLGQGGSRDPYFSRQRGVITQPVLGSSTAWSEQDLNTLERCFATCIYSTQSNRR